MSYITEFPLTTLLYVFMLSMVLINSYLAMHIKGRRSKRIFLLLVIVLLSALSGLRDSTVGNDTWVYIRAIESAKLNYSGELFYNYYDFGFQLLIKSLVNIFNDPHIVILIISFLINSLVILALWNFRTYINFSISVFLYYTIYYFESFNIMRQWIAVALVLYGLNYLINNCRNKYIFTVILATSIHFSAIISLTFVPLYDIVVKKTVLKKKIIYVFSTFIFSVITYYISLQIGLLSEFEAKYHYYFQNFTLENIQIGFFFIIRLIVILYSIYVLKVNISKSNDKELIRFFIFLTLIGTSLTMVGYAVTYVGRIGLYAMVCEVLLLSMIAKNRSHSIMLKVLIIGIGLYVFVNSLMLSGQGHVPYSTFFKW
ncbi:EpsG family protein [Serpentinicella alkaliphila]|uniref:EpsG-like putative glucosyltransferase n=1 Tax=Serpentinicella alkaliphila TaxID=1734049 RepID=A0A4R2T879_9FIRM|nr:EpsG family protein [Serpentinicella alkaliphila]QUH25040.1 EpsG family protein [Serpentinicella alkaliphila]TCP98405.1 EpsG-like putative glucosyltransferase [Serpentinicella alkaliphila]